MIKTTGLLLVLASILSQSYAQPESCSTACRALSGQCGVSLSALARTPCLDTRSNTERTCDCNLNLDSIQALSERDVIRDCVIPLPIIGFGDALDIKAKMINVHLNRISNTGRLSQSGDIRRSTICGFGCTGRNQFQNCILSGSVFRSTFDNIFANGRATVSISGDKFVRSKVDSITSEEGIQIGCKDGFDNNKIELLATSRSGRFSSVLGTKIRNNDIGLFSAGPISSFAELDGNTAEIANMQGPCAVLNVKSKIITDRLTLPRDEPECARMFEEA